MWKRCAASTAEIRKIRPDIVEYDLGPGRAESFAFYEDGICAMAVQPDLPEVSKRAAEIRAWGFWARPPVSGKWLSTSPTCLEEIDQVGVRAQQRFIETMEPEWIERVKEEWEMYQDEVEVVYWSKLPAETVRAILEMLLGRGEIEIPET